MKALIIDTETGGLNELEHSCLSVGACVVNLDSGEIVDTYRSLVKLDTLDSYKVTVKALEVNQLSIQDCFENGKWPQEIANDLVDMYIRNGCLAIGGHNVWFDIRFLTQHIFQCSIPEFIATFTYHVIDSMPITRLLNQHEAFSASSSLEKVCSKLKISPKDYVAHIGHHDALYDCVSTAQLLYRIRKAFTSVAI